MKSISTINLYSFLFKRCDNKKVVKLAKRTVSLWLLSVILWIIDRIFCTHMININFPYFHSVFHVTILFSSHWTIVLFSYFTAVERVPQLKPCISYWQENETHRFSNYLSKLIPYVSFLSNNVTKDSLPSKQTKILNNSSSTVYKFA